MGPIWYRMRVLMRAQRSRNVALALMVAAVAGPVLALAAGVVRTTSAPGRYESRLGGSDDVALEQQAGRPRTAEVASLPAVAAIHNATFVFGGIVRKGQEKPVDGFVFAGSHLAFRTRVTRGRESRASVPGEFLATPSWLARSRAQVGDRFQLVTISAEQAAAGGFDVADPNGPRLAATLVGVIDGPIDLQDPNPFAVFPDSLLDVGDVGTSATVGSVSLARGASVGDLRHQLDRLPAGDVFGLDTAQVVPSEFRAAVRVQGQALAVVVAIMAVAGVALTGQVLSRQVRLPDSQRLAMSSIGMTRAQIVADPLCSSALPIAVGSVGAVGLAFAASGLFPVGFVRRVEPSPGLRFEPVVHVLGAALLAILLALVVLVALLLADRSRTGEHRPGVVENLAARLRPGPAATGLRFALTRHPRDPGSTRAPILGLLLVLTVLYGAITFGVNIGRLIDVPALYGTNFDLDIGAGGNAVSPEVRTVLERNPDVTDVTLYGTVLASVGTASLDVTGMEPLRGHIRPDVLSGRLPQNEDEIVLGRVAARDLAVKPGDDLVVTGAGAPATYKVTGLAVIPGIEGGDGIGKGGVVTFGGLRRIDSHATLGTAAVRLRPGAKGAQQRLAAALQKQVGPGDRPLTILNLERVRSAPFIVVAALGALAVLGLAHQLTVSGRRRRRDLAVLRALGADDRWVTSVLHWQATVLAVAVAVLAIPFGVATGRALYSTYIDRVGARADMSTPFVKIGLVVVAIVALANLAALGPAWRVRRDHPGRVLADE